MSYRWWFEKIMFLVSGIACTWQAWSVSIIYGGNHSITLGVVQSAPHWAASLMPGVQSNTERLARDNMLSKYSEQQTWKSSIALTSKKENKQNRELKSMRVFWVSFFQVHENWQKLHFFNDSLCFISIHEIQEADMSPLGTGPTLTCQIPITILKMSLYFLPLPWAMADGHRWKKKDN